MAGTTDTRATGSGTTTLALLRTGAVLCVLDLVWQFVTAGQLFPSGGPEELHGTGATVLHVLTGLTAVAAAVHWRATRGPWWPTLLAVVVFGWSFGQAQFGGHDTLTVHVPGALALAIGTVWLATWACTRAARR